MIKTSILFSILLFYGLGTKKENGGNNGRKEEEEKKKRI
jgi:hypothetical protein